MKNFINTHYVNDLKKLIRLNTGILLDGNKVAYLDRELEKRATTLGLGSFAAYYQFITEHPEREDEWQKIIDLIAVNETYFLREHEHFSALLDIIIPTLLEKKNERHLRIWSAGCSTGEEPYSIAMIMQEAKQIYGNFEVEIIGTDIDLDALDKAKVAQYNKNSFRSKSEEYHRFDWRKYFEVEGDLYQVIPEILKMVEFQYINLTSDSYPNVEISNFDIIFCRNVTIYFDRDTLKTVHLQLASSLQENGYLFLSSAETPHHDLGELELVELGGVFVFCKRPHHLQKKEEIQLPKPPEKVMTLPPIPENKQQLLSRKKIPPQELPSQPKSEAFYKLDDALIYFQREEYDIALKIVDKILRKNPQDTETSLLKVNILINQEKFDHAEETCQAIQETDNWNVTIAFFLGLINFYQKEWENARQYLAKAIFLRSDFGLAHYFMGQVYEQLENHTKARREYNNALKNLEKGILPGFSIKSLQLICEKKISELILD